MFGWLRRKNDGFEWREYVRTTIKIRREDRARKIDEIKQAAADGAKAAGRRSVAAGQSGLMEAWRGLVASSRWLTSALVAACRHSARGAVAGGSHLVDGLRRGTFVRSVRDLSAHTKIALMFGALGVLAGLSAILQIREAGFDWPAALSVLVAVILLGLAGAPWLRQFGARARQMRVAMPPVRSMAIAGGVAVLGGAGLWAAQSNAISSASSSVVSLMPSISLGASVPDIAGRGEAVSGDTIRIRGRVVRLAGIEAPEIVQICRDKRDRAWNCGQRARIALRRIIRGEKLKCSNVGRADGGRFTATCRIGKEDIAENLVEAGYAFAQGMIFKTYSEAEAKAKSAKAGVWQGDVQRPAEFRAKRWEIASKSAPDGCPIKGRVVRKAKVYVLPWALDYRQVRVREARGERWFCSESEATSAGFRPSSTG